MGLIPSLSLSLSEIQTSQDARFYAASASFDKFSNADKTLVVQFTVKHEQKIDCGGGYVKVRREREREGESTCTRGREREGGEGEYMYMYSFWVRGIGGVCTCVEFLS